MATALRRHHRQSLNSSPDRTKRTALESFNGYKPLVIQPKHIGWMVITIAVLTSPYQYSDVFLYHFLQMLLDGALDVLPPTWNEIVKEIESISSEAMEDGREADMQKQIHDFALHLKDRDRMNQFITEECHKALADKTARPTDGYAMLKKSWLGLHLRKCRLAYLKLSDAAAQRLQSAFNSWVEDKPVSYDFNRDTLELPGYQLITTFVDQIGHSTTDSYERFEYDKHTGNMAGASTNLRHYFDQRFTAGRQPPRQHALNTLAHYYTTAGEFEAARLEGAEAIDIARSIGDRKTLVNVMSLMRRIPSPPTPFFYHDPHDSHLRKVLLERENVYTGTILGAKQSNSSTKVQDQYTIIQMGTSPLDLLFDVKVGIREGEPLSFLFQKRFEALGCLDLPRDLASGPLDTQWQIMLVDNQLWRLAGMASVAQIGDSLILSKTSHSSTARLHTIVTGARQLFMRGLYLQAFMVLLRPDNWSCMNFEHYLYWSTEIWLLMWDLATRRGQERLMKDWLERKRPLGAKERLYGQGKDKRSALELEKKGSVKAIKRRIIEAADAMRCKDHSRATILILEALHHAEKNGYWYLYRSAVPIFAELELQRGKVQSAKARLEEILHQVSRGEDLEQRAMVYAVYAKAHMAGDPKKTRESLTPALSYLKLAEADYRTLEMYAPIQDMLYLQAVIHETSGDRAVRDAISNKLLEAEKEEVRLREEMDPGLMDIWDVVCEIGVAVAKGDTYHEGAVEN